MEKSSEEVEILALQSDLRASNFVASLARNPTTLLIETMKRAYHEMKVEEMLEGKFKKVRTHICKQLWQTKQQCKDLRSKLRKGGE